MRRRERLCAHLIAIVVIEERFTASVRTELVGHLREHIRPPLQRAHRALAERRLREQPRRRRPCLSPILIAQRLEDGCTVLLIVQQEQRRDARSIGQFCHHALDALADVADL